MLSFFYAMITVFGWGTWLAPSHKVTFPNQQIKTLYVVATNLIIATTIALWQGDVSELSTSTFWLTLIGGIIWAAGGLCAFTATNNLGIAKAFGIWAPLNYGMLLLVGVLGAGFTIAQISIVVNALIGIYWFHEPAPSSRAARLTFIGCVLATMGGIVLGNLK